MGGKKWTEAQEAAVRKFYANAPTKVIAAAVGRSESSVYQLAQRLGLRKSDTYLSSPEAGRFDGTRGEACRFPKGHEPWNKGTSFQPGGKSVETRFKPGSRPHTWQPVGSYRITKDGTLQRKISDAPGSNSKRWRGVHELVWIECNGPVPAGHIVVFKPGMRTADVDLITVDKVECISFADNMRRNTLHRYPKHITDAIRARAVLNRRINHVENHQ
ncbi:HNH endonuclease [Achromobacter sp. NPDC058515]|uniref:HNH endonuclease n=1 Tax=Achromobacter sp. NPDC058515 TaxID=3346533 RepID=UPI00366053F9